MIIYRKKIDEAKKIYEYYDKNNKKITDKKILEYISKLSIPPAYESVEIFIERDQKIVFQGLDKAGRLQQIYSPKWRAKADKAKFKALIDFGKKLPLITLNIMNSIKSPVLNKEKIICIILRITTLCGFRIGSLKYQKLYGSTGVITLQTKHLKLKPDGLHINFIGKKGMKNDCVVKEEVVKKELLKLMQGKSPNDFVFVYPDNVGSLLQITANDVNDWLKNYDSSFTSKFFRNFSVNAKFIEVMNEIDQSSCTDAQRKKKVKEVLVELSATINNTPTICRKAYLDPSLVDLYINHPRKYKKIIDENLKVSSTKAYVAFLESVHKN